MMNTGTGSETSDYDPQLYAPEAVSEGVRTLADLSGHAVAVYRRDGFLVVREAFSRDVVKTACDAIAHLIARGENAPYILEYESASPDVSTSSAQQRADAVRKLQGFVNYEPRLHAIANSPQLLRIVSEFIGEPAMLFQDLALLKPPRVGREKPWHQDKAFFDLPLETPVVGVWIALDEATVENGCMQMLAGGHKNGVIAHFQRRDWQL